MNGAQIYIDGIKQQYKKHKEIEDELFFFIRRSKDPKLSDEERDAVMNKVDNLQIIYCYSHIKY